MMSRRKNSKRPPNRIARELDPSDVIARIEKEDMDNLREHKRLAVDAHKVSLIMTNAYQQTLERVRKKYELPTNASINPEGEVRAAADG
jgi:hypothetical protein